MWLLARPTDCIVWASPSYVNFVCPICRPWINSSVFNSHIQSVDDLWYSGSHWSLKCQVTSFLVHQNNNNTTNNNEDAASLSSDVVAKGMNKSKTREASWLHSIVRGEWCRKSRYESIVVSIRYYVILVFITYNNIAYFFKFNFIFPGIFS